MLLTFVRIFSTELNEAKCETWIKIEETTFANFDLFYFSSLIFKKLVFLLKKITPSEKVIIVEEGLAGINIDDIGNFEDSPRHVFIDEECEHLIVVNDGGELARQINQNKKSDVLLGVTEIVPQSGIEDALDSFTLM